MAVIAAHHEERRPLKLNQLGLWLFFLSESFLFAALLTARFYIAGVDRPDELNQALGLGITSVLLTSSVTAFLAENAMATGDRKAFSRYLLATIALGCVFVGGVGVEWTGAEFHLTGLHASHVVSGIVILLLVYNLARRGQFSPDSHWGVEASIKYWHFVDVVWVFFYPALYLIGW